MRKALTPKQRFEIFKRDGFTCRYCGANGEGVQLQVDHIEPVSKGGKCEDGNYITACKTCNTGKAANRVIPEDEKLYTKSELIDEVSSYGLYCDVCGIHAVHSLDSGSREHHVISFDSTNGVVFGLCIACIGKEIKELDEWRYRLCSNLIAASKNTEAQDTAFRKTREEHNSLYDY